MIEEGCSIALSDGTAILLVQRANPPFANFWTLPGGRIEHGETAEDAIRRETWEELGIVATMPIAVTSHEVADGKRRFRLVVFTAFLPHRAPVVSSEIANWEWVTPAEIGGYRTTPGLSTIVTRCLARLEETGP